MRHSRKNITTALCTSLVAIAALGGQFILPAAAYGQAIEVLGRRPVPHHHSPSPTVIDGAVNIIGFDDVRANKAGRLVIGDEEIRLSGGAGDGVITTASVKFLAIEHTSKGLLRGTAGAVAALAPNGAGQLYSAFRPGAEMLTLFYVDEYQALHGTVIMLPKSSKDAVLQAFAQVGLVPSGSADALDDIADQAADRIEFVPASDSTSPEEMRPKFAGSEESGKLSSIRISPPSAHGILPPAFVAASYEELVAQANKSKQFATVWRQGDVRAPQDGLALRLEVTEFRKGSAGVWGAIPVVGMIAGKTLIRADLRLEDAPGRVLLQQEVNPKRPTKRRDSSGMSASALHGSRRATGG